jgi:hypothetical protein
MPLPEFRIASPCTADWDKMIGDNRVRHCAECHLDVYNFSAMPTAEVEHLLANRSGRLCARFYRRADGTVLTQNCPVGFRGVVRRVSRVAGAAFSVVLSLGVAAAQKPGAKHTPLQIQPAAADLTVIVLDPTGAVIANAKVTLQQISGALEMHGVTDSNGAFRSSALTAGTYKATIRALGFKDAEKLVTLREGDNSQSAVQLEVVDTLMGVIVEGAIEPEPIPANSSIPDALPLATTPPASPSQIKPHRSFASRLLHKLGW